MKRPGVDAIWIGYDHVKVVMKDLNALFDYIEKLEAAAREVLDQIDAGFVRDLAAGRDYGESRPVKNLRAMLEGSPDE